MTNLPSLGMIILYSCRKGDEGVAIGSLSSYNSYATYGKVTSMYANAYSKSNSSLFGSTKEQDSPFASLYASSTSYDTKLQRYGSDVKTASSVLKRALGELTAKQGSSSSARQIAKSSDEKSLAVANNGTTYGKFTETRVKIDQVASGQVNKGDALKANANAGLSGRMQFAIDVDGKTHQFTFNASSADTNQAIQQKMADAINTRGIGITASVSRDGASASLTLEAKETGAVSASRFAVRDVAGAAVGKTGADLVAQKAQDAIYHINGGTAKMSRTNAVDLGGGVTATLVAASDQEITVSKVQDDSGKLTAAKNMIDSFNSLLSSADSMSSTSRGAIKLTRELQGISKSYASSLNQLGIGVTKDGALAVVDSDKRAKAAESGDLDRLMNGGGAADYGFANRLSKVANNISRFPAQYVNAVPIELMNMNAKVATDNISMLFSLLI